MEESSDIVTWTKSGQAFQVVDYARFSDEILLKYFRHNKFSSFRRQLNLYGYRKVIKGPDAGAYMHPSFQRGRPDLLKDVKKGKVPHYDMHGINEIHGQHFRHHPPGEKTKEEPSPTRSSPAQVTPTLNPHEPPLTPEGLRASPPPAPPLPPQRLVTKTEVTAPPSSADALTKFSNMSLGSMTESAAERWVDGMLADDEGPTEESGADSPATLKPAYGGGGNPGDGTMDMSDPSQASFMGGFLEGTGFDRNGCMGVGGGAGGGSSRPGGASTEAQSAAPEPYWSKRQEEAPDLVFPKKAPANTAAIFQRDPNISDVVNVICQCMEVRSSTEDSSQSQMSQCSFNADVSRRSSIPDLLSCISWEMAQRASNTPRLSRLGSLLGAMDEDLADRVDGSGSGAGAGPDGVSAELGSGLNLNVADGSRGGEGDSNGNGTGNGNGGQQHLGGGVNVVNAVHPTVISLAGTPSPGPPRPRGGPDPSAILSSELASGQKRDGGDLDLRAAVRNSPLLPARCSPSPPSTTSSRGGHDTYVKSEPPGRLQPRGPRPVVRIFKPAPKSAFAPTTSRAWSSESGGSTAGSEDDTHWNQASQPGASGAWSSTTSGSKPSTYSAPSVGSVSMTTTPGRPTSTMVSSSPLPAPHNPVYHPSKLAQHEPPQQPPPPPEEHHVSSPNSHAWPNIGRKMSATWLREPVPERRPTIQEAQQVDRLLAKTPYRAAWHRVADDQDSMSLAHSIGEFIG